MELKPHHAAALAKRTLEGLALLLLLVFCGVGIYQIATFYAPNIDSHLLTALIVFVPLGLVALVAKARSANSDTR